jgi:hypothetical protein
MIRDEQEVRDYLEALETMYTAQGLAGTELSKTDPRIQVLRWVLKRDDVSTHIEDIIREWRNTEKEAFSIPTSTSTSTQQNAADDDEETTSKLSTLLQQQQAATTG